MKKIIALILPLALALSLAACTSAKEDAPEDAGTPEAAEPADTEEPAETGRQETQTEPEEPVRKVVIGDLRLFSNSLSKLLTTLQNAGIKASSRKYETEKYIEYKVRIPKKDSEPDRCTQLKIC